MLDDLTLLWAGIIAFVVVMYVLLDGFDLGIGILFPFMRDEDERDNAMNTVAPVWDFNETWLILGGTGIFGAFPLAYAVLLPAFYLPILIMLIALIFRGVAFEFRFKVHAHRARWGWSFFGGSLLATFAQGLILGSFVQGVPVADRQFAGGAFDWLTPFSLLTGAALVVGYALLGATWLILKTVGPLNVWARRVSLYLLGGVLVSMALVSLAVPFLDTDIAARWFSWPNILYLSPVPLLVALTTFLLYRSLESGREILPFLFSITLFLLGYAGLAISLWPNIIPPDISIWEAAAPPESQVFLLVGMAILVPTILLYHAYTLWVFRGKVTTGYH